MASPPTGNREFRDDVVRVAALTVNTMVLEGLTFQNCRIIGPAVLIPQGETAFIHCTWEAPDMNAIFWEIGPERTTIVGAVAVVDCTFSSCSFYGVGIGGPAEARSQLARGFSEGGPQQQR